MLAQYEINQFNRLLDRITLKIENRPKNNITVFQINLIKSQSDKLVKKGYLEDNPYAADLKTCAVCSALYLISASSSIHSINTPYPSVES